MQHSFVHKTIFDMGYRTAHRKCDSGTEQTATYRTHDTFYIQTYNPHVCRRADGGRT